ncbi:MAG: ABC transporter ATP-binding protein [Rhodobacteraceae bacterium]|nr:ABC transporter ATP-binding protein [Paracoccaceae bacterium]
MASIEFLSTSKNFGSVKVIEDLNLMIQDGSFTVFVGPSGCGKSTLLRLLAGLEEITSGQIKIGGRVVNNMGPVERGIAMVFQNYALYPHMTVAQNIGFSLRMARVPRSDRKKLVQNAAELLQLTEYLNRKPAQLSGGQRQRVAIGRAIVRSPTVFLFDEPLSNLDAELRASMRVEIAKLHKSINKTMVYVTHDQVEAMTLADQIVVLRAGKIEQKGTPNDLYENPDNQFVAGFIGSPKMNFFAAKWLSGESERGKIELGDGQLLQANLSVETKNDSVIVGIRPEHFVFSDNLPNQISLRPEFIENLGGVYHIIGQLKTGEPVVVESREKIHIGQAEIVVGVAPEYIHVFGTSGERLQ